MSSLVGRLSDVLHKTRALWVGLVYFALISVANYSAFWLRFEGSIPPAETALGLRMLPWLLGITAVAFVPFDLYRGSWRYTSIWDLRDLVGAVALSTVGFSIVVYLIFDQWTYPRSVVISSAMLSISLIGGVRLMRRIADEMFRGATRHKRPNRVLIVGAGNAGEMIARDLRRKGDEPIGFIDDDVSKTGQTIQRTRVLGTGDDLQAVVATERPDEVLIAIPSAGPAAIRRFVREIEHFKVPITTLPPLREIVDGKVSASQVRRVAVEDLLPRAAINFDTERARELVEGRRVLVTGAGGSIGSELCRQIAALDPDRLILYERYENNLYSVLNTLPRHFRVKPALGDVTDRRRLHSVMREHQPDIIFHAAAHKHVPLMELNPCEAVKNNVIGTRMVAEAATHFGVDRFILISTDKAVNPASLMGATKRVAELVIQAMATAGGPRLGTVRFGNVLGSSGSVIPRWLEQIAAGGPVTVTHPAMERYFMLVPEAVQLILQAATLTRGGEIFVLEMGEQINLVKMARDLIRLSGFIPDEEIALRFVGLRAGEKLREELIGPDETQVPSPVEKVLQLRIRQRPNPNDLLARVTALGTMAVRGQLPAVIELLCAIVPTFQPGADLTQIPACRGAQAAARTVTASRITSRSRVPGLRAAARSPVRHSSSTNGGGQHTAHDHDAAGKTAGSIVLAQSGNGHARVECHLPGLADDGSGDSDAVTTKQDARPVPAVPHVR